MALACARVLALSFFLLPRFARLSHENHVGTKQHSAWLVPVQLVAIERSADSSRGDEKERERGRERGEKGY